MPFGQESDDRGEDQKREGILPWLLQVVLAMCVFHPDDGPNPNPIQRMGSSG